MARSDRVSSVLVLAMLLASAASAIEVSTGTDDLVLHINPQVQPRFELDFDGPPGSASPSGQANFDFFIRRARLLVRGIAYKQFTFAILLNAARLGERGNYKVAIALQDVHIGYVPVKWGHRTQLVPTPASSEQVMVDANVRAPIVLGPLGTSPPRWHGLRT